MLNSTSSARYRQQAEQGRKQHDFSPRTPPRSGRFIYGHWTPYTPPDPATYPPQARTHVIQRGDSMWGIANKHYGDPYLWPYVWEANSWITYPHWIYPGDTLLVPPLMTLPAGQLQEEIPKFPDIAADYFPASGIDAIYCGHFIADPNDKPFGRIIGAEADPEPELASTGDMVYVNLGSKDDVLPGDEFAILYPREHLALNPAELKFQRNDVLLHPTTGEKLGIPMKMSGRLRIVLLGDDVSTAVITRACDVIEAGAELMPFTEVPIPLVRRKEREPRVLSLPQEGRGSIVWIEDRRSAGGQGTLVSIDLGSDHGVMPGDVFRVFREGSYSPFVEVDHLGGWWDRHNAKRQAKRRRPMKDRTIYGKQEPVAMTPPRIHGELVVLYTQHGTATARVISTTREVFVGDRIVYEPVDSGLASVAIVQPPGSASPSRSRR